MSLAHCLLYFIEIPVFNANSVDPDQMQHSVASGLGLHRIFQLEWLICVSHDFRR